VNDVAPLGLVQMGLGQVGRSLIRQALAAGERYPWLVYRGAADRSGLVWRPQGWTRQDLTDLLRAKDAGQSLRQYWNGRGAAHGVFVNERFDRGAASVQPLAAAVAAGEDMALVDVTAERNAYAATLAAREAGAHVVLCNKWSLTKIRRVMTRC